MALPEAMPWDILKPCHLRENAGFTRPSAHTTVGYPATHAASEVETTKSTRQAIIATHRPKVNTKVFIATPNRSRGI